MLLRSSTDPSSDRRQELSNNRLEFYPNDGIIESPGVFTRLTSGYKQPVARLDNSAQRRWIVNFRHGEEWSSGKFILEFGWSTSGTSTSAISYQVAMFGVPEGSGTPFNFYFKSTSSLTPTGTAEEWQTLVLESNDIDKEYRHYTLHISRVVSSNTDFLYLSDITAEYILLEQ